MKALVTAATVLITILAVREVLGILYDIGAALVAVNG